MSAVLEPTLLLLWSTHDQQLGRVYAPQRRKPLPVSYTYTSDFYFFVTGTHTLNLKLSVGLAKRQTHELPVPLTPRHILDLQPLVNIHLRSELCSPWGPVTVHSRQNKLPTSAGVDTGYPAQKQAGLSSPVLQISETHFTLVLKTKNVDPKGFPTVISLFRHLCGRNKDFSPAPF